VLVCDRN